MPQKRLKSSLPGPPTYEDSFTFYREHDVVTFIRANDTAEKRGVEVRSGVVLFRPGGMKNCLSRAVWIMDTTNTPKKGVKPHYWRLEHVRIYTVRRDQRLIAKVAFIRGDV